MKFAYTTPEGNYSDEQQFTATYELTTNHPSTSHGLPVLRDVATGQVYGPSDRLPHSRKNHAADVVEQQEHEYSSAADRDLIAKFLSQRA